ncbi:MAG TPA: hypothetical protein PKZ53_15415, partial [Acidobacteriota bacterium]|nr:hypothetical protein [Acidobacteriota bacterium]
MCLYPSRSSRTPSACPDSHAPRDQHSVSKQVGFFMELVKVTIDGKEYQAPKGKLLIEVCKDQG